MVQFSTWLIFPSFLQHSHPSAADLNIQQNLTMSTTSKTFGTAEELQAGIDLADTQIRKGIEDGDVLEVIPCLKYVLVSFSSINNQIWELI